MKKFKYLSLLVSLSFIAIMFLPGLVKNDRAQGQGGEEKRVVEKESGATSAKDKFSEEKREFGNKTKEELDKIDKNELELKMKKAGSRVKAEAKESLQDLKKKRVALKKDVERLERSGSRTWEAAKRKARDAMNDLEEAYNKVRDKLMSE